MAKKKREIQEINASSMADIAFLLLIFFLVTTSMATDKGLSRTLPPPVQDTVEQKIPPRNIMMVLINSNNQLMVNDQLMDVRDLRKKTKEFISNPTNDPSMPEKDIIDVPYFGLYPTLKKHVISLQNDRGTSYQAYIDVQNELVAAYRELREELARQKFNSSLEDLDEEKFDAIKTVIPQNISEAEPRNYGGGN
jgi:biopolymer transport protein ExbD